MINVGECISSISEEIKVRLNLWCSTMGPMLQWWSLWKSSFLKKIALSLIELTIFVEVFYMIMFNVWEVSSSVYEGKGEFSKVKILVKSFYSNLFECLKLCSLFVGSLNMMFEPCKGVLRVVTYGMKLFSYD